MCFLQQLYEHGIKSTFFIFSLKIGSEAEFLISLATFFQSWLAPYAMLSKPNFFSGILRFIYMKISQIAGIFSEVKDVTHNVKRKVIQAFISLSQKEFYAFLVDWFSICILQNYFEIRGVVLLNKAQALFMYAVNSTNRKFCAKHPS